MAILEIRDLSLVLDQKKILDKVSLEFWEGFVHGVVGPNGAGKSTLASTIMGLAGYRHFDGDIIFDGKSLKGMGLDERARLGITLGWQEPARFEGLLVEDFIKAAASDKRPMFIEEALIRAGLEPSLYLKRAVDKTLSGGERKKVELASILAMSPRLVLLDEPDSGIDIDSLDRIFDAIKFLKSQKSTVILITHSLAVLNQTEHAFLMCCGEIRDKGVTSKITPYFTNRCMACDHKNLPKGEA